jgi:hypothetical protein
MVLEEQLTLEQIKEISTKGVQVEFVPNDLEKN